MKMMLLVSLTVIVASLFICQIPVVESAGLTLDPCREQKHCKKNRICRTARTLAICKATSDYCGCVPINEDEARCDQTTQCDAGETCFHPELWQESPACISNAQIPSIANPKTCQSDEDCVPDRVCAFVTLVQGYCAIPFIDMDSKPPSGQIDPQVEPIAIADFDGAANQSLSVELSQENDPFGAEELIASSPPNDFTEEALDSSEQEDFDLNDRACIASRALKHLHPQSLLYKNDFYAKVLCDSNGSCSTPGHIVYYNSKPMMMKSYCAKIACVERIMAVNSVKYSQNLRIASSTPNLYYTAFSARHQTLAEELALAFAVFLRL